VFLEGEDPKVLQALQEQKAHKVLQVQVELKAQLVVLVVVELKVLKEDKVLQALQAPLVLLEPRAL
jgi:hypothetical protein